MGKLTPGSKMQIFSAQKLDRQLRPPPPGLGAENECLVGRSGCHIRTPIVDELGHLRHAHFIAEIKGVPERREQAQDHIAQVAA
jgi:hypothetical protein